MQEECRSMTLLIIQAPADDAEGPGVRLRVLGLCRVLVSLVSPEHLHRMSPGLCKKSSPCDDAGFNSNVAHPEMRTLLAAESRRFSLTC